MQNLTKHAFTVTAQTRAQQKQQQPVVVWLTGLSGSGKSTVASALEQRLVAQGRHTYLLDGDSVRLGLCSDLGFSDIDRQENIRRVSEVAKLFVEAGLIVITAFISPFHRDRALAKRVVGADRFVEVYISTPLEECERRDPKGLYKKAREGHIKNFTGIDSPYEIPNSPQVRVETLDRSVDECVTQILNHLER
jgi:adenylylsulfate kinase